MKNVDINVAYPNIKSNQAIFFLSKNYTPRPIHVDGGFYGQVELYSSIPNAAGGRGKPDFSRNGGITTLSFTDSKKILCLFIEFEKSFEADKSNINHYFVGEYATGEDPIHDMHVIQEYILPRPKTVNLIKQNFIYFFYKNFFVYLFASIL